MSDLEVSFCGLLGIQGFGTKQHKDILAHLGPRKRSGRVGMLFLRSGMGGMENTAFGRPKAGYEAHVIKTLDTRYNVLMTATRHNPNLLRCQGCGKPLAKRGPAGIRIQSYNRGRPTEVVVNAQHSSGGVLSVGCQECAGRITPHYFITLRHPSYLQSKKA